MTRICTCRSTIIKHSSQVIELLNEYGDRLYRLLVRLTLREDVAQDLLQEMVIKLAHADGFMQATYPYAYARTAAMNLAISWMRKGGQHHESLNELQHAAAHPPPWVALIQVEDTQRMLLVLSELSEKDQLLLTMRYFDESPYREIATAVGCTEQQARGLCFKALRRLREKFTPTDTTPQSKVVSYER